MKVKRLFDFLSSLIGILILGLPSILIYILASIDTASSGIFVQERVGQFGKVFSIYKFKTIHPKTRKASFFGKLLRRTKLDEIPQLFNVLKGDMSIVGPRPDIPGYYDRLEGEDRKVLNLKPGITSEASIKYRNEEALLSQQKDPLRYNDEVLFPDKIRMNLDYYYKRNLFVDLMIIIKTFV